MQLETGWRGHERGPELPAEHVACIFDRLTELIGGVVECRVELVQRGIEAGLVSGGQVAGGLEDIIEVLSDIPVTAREDPGHQLAAAGVRCARLVGPPDERAGGLDGIFDEVDREFEKPLQIVRVG